MTITCAMLVLLAGLGLLMLQGWARTEARRRRAREERDDAGRPR